MVGSVAIIHSRPGTVRSNHYHKTDAHYLYCVRGCFSYRECAPDEDVSMARPIRVRPGDLLYTPPGRVHRCEFDEYTILVSASKLTRTHENHEADVVRV